MCIYLSLANKSPMWSLQPTPNIELDVMSAKLRFLASLVRSIVKAQPAKAPLPKGLLDNRFFCSPNLNTSSRRNHAWLLKIKIDLHCSLRLQSQYLTGCRLFYLFFYELCFRSIKKELSCLKRKWLHKIGCARWRCVYPGAMMSISDSARLKST